MAKCDVCGQAENMPYQCRHCGGTHCSDHRLPESHDCPGLDDWGDPQGVFDSGFDDSVRTGSAGTGSVLERIGLETGPGGSVAYFRNNVSYTFLAVMLIVFVLEHVVLLLFGPGTFEMLFVLTSAHPEYVWTWVTSVFAHAPGTFFHIFGNGIVLFFFGPVLERQIGSKRFTALFLVSGMAAGLGQIASGFVLGTPITAGVLGASGAIMAILGVLTVLNPDLKVYLYFLLPIPIWVLTFGYAGLSLVGVFSTVRIGGNIAHFAHLLGLVIGLAYGQMVKSKTRVPNELQFGRRGPGGPGRRF